MKMMNSPPTEVAPPPTRPRDFVGYGATPPRFAWPNGARVAISVVINVEEGAERAVARGDARDDLNGQWSRHSAPPAQRNLTLESAFEYGSRAGIWRLLRVLRRHRIRATVFACGTALELNPSVAEALVEDGHEIANHGLQWDEHAQLAPGEEERLIAAATDSLAVSTGTTPRCWYSRDGISPTTRELLRDRGYTYDSNSFADDLPYHVSVGGVPHPVLPYTGDANDSGLVRVFPTGRAFTAFLRENLAMLATDPRPGPSVMSIGLHPRLIGRPAYAGALDRFIVEATTLHDVWFATRAEIVAAWETATA